MTEESESAVTSSQGQSPQSPRKALGGILAFVGLWFLLMGLNGYYAASKVEDMYAGTSLDHDADTRRITQNSKSSAVRDIWIGVAGILIGAKVAGSGKKEEKSE